MGAKSIVNSFSACEVLAPQIFTQFHFDPALQLPSSPRCYWLASLLCTPFKFLCIVHTRDEASGLVGLKRRSKNQDNRNITSQNISLPRRGCSGRRNRSEPLHIV
ncbi:hypothetical protein GJ744_000678 [Endocarpon pusillum]|uniref:Uncharacterized protein n=1 Tax=Endocarpon pusillum TaxID=364733 RepID=A0A8H7AE92_9EURO|nr:hypothetical protein GJ744_000678 [Endocarpon pusillum]